MATPRSHGPHPCHSCCRAPVVEGTQVKWPGVSVVDRGEPVASCSVWHGAGTAGEDDCCSDLAVTVPAGGWGEARPRRRQPRWQALIEGAAAPGRLAVAEVRVPSACSVALAASSTSPVGLSVPYRTPVTPPSQNTAVSVRTAPNDNQGPSWRSPNSTPQPGCPALLGSTPRTVASGKLRPRTRIGWSGWLVRSTAQRSDDPRAGWNRSGPTGPPAARARHRGRGGLPGPERRAADGSRCPCPTAYHVSSRILLASTGDRDVVADSADGLPAEDGRRRRPPAGPALRWYGRSSQHGRLELRESGRNQASAVLPSYPPN
jgi:hypothetical protein